MKIQSAEFIRGIIGTQEILYDGKFQIAFMGRSNVGKSSLINSLVNKQNLARTSTTPGKTIRLDFFLINNKFYFVDLPGYGYAKVSKKRHEKIRKMMLWYLMYSNVKNRLVVLIIDAKIGITAYDRQTLEIFHKLKIDHVIVVNKIDKLKMGEKEKQLKKIQDDCRNSKVITCSAKLKFGKDELMREISLFIS